MAVRRDRHHDIGKIQTPAARAAEDDARRRGDCSASGGDQHVDLAGSWPGRADDEIAIGATGAAGGQRRQADRGEHGGAGNPRRRPLDLRARAPPRDPAGAKIDHGRFAQSNGRGSTRSAYSTAPGARIMPCFGGSSFLCDMNQ